MTFFRTVAAPLAIALALAGCQAKEGKDAGAEATATTAPEAAPGAQLTDGKLVLPAVSGNPGAAYFTLSNTGKDTVSIAAVAVEGAGKAEMHQTMSGEMRPVDRADVEPGTALKFEPGSFHVMVFDLDPKLAAGGTTELTITLANGDKVSAPLAIEAAGSSGGEMNMGHR
ncbi:copper chaperone PCu(A)C [Novosphingobium sp.]|uniref:copper chaperone PCu(A)C n=1 Tax=Novosphingobium sp. TaxID=1874826 RepID=UPI0035AFB407